MDGAKTEETHTIAVLVENEFGVLARISGMFAARGFNIEALSVAPTEDPKVSRLTLITRGEPRVIEQIAKQLNRLIDVIKVLDLSSQDCLRRELMLLKLSFGAEQRAALKETLTRLGALVVEEKAELLIAQFAFEHEQNDAALQELKSQYRVVETLRSGNLAMHAGAQTLLEA